MYSAKGCLADIKLAGKIALESPFKPCKECVITMGGFGHCTCHRGLTDGRSSAGSRLASALMLAQQKKR